MTSFQKINTYGFKLDRADRNRAAQTRIRIRIPKNHYQEPVISNLIARHHLDVNILAAFLGVNTCDDGWFDLQLKGQLEQIDNALIYLSELDVEIWSESELELDGW